MQDYRDNYKALMAEKKGLEQQIETVKQEFMAALGDHEIGIVGAKKVTWKTVERKEYTVEATSYRQLRIN
jgi:hypothetical protein